MEKSLLHAALSSRTSHNLIQEHVKPKARNKKDTRYSEEFRILLDKIAAYYENDKDAERVDINVFHKLIDTTIPVDKHKERLKGIVDEAINTETSVPNINTLIIQAKRHEVGVRLAQKLINRDDVKEELEEYNSLLNQELTEVEEEDTAFRGDSLEALLMRREDEAYGIRLRPRALNDAIGGKGLPPGSKVTIFGRPEIAKSAFCITNAAGWVMDGKRVLYLINEDPAENIYFRLVCCLTGMTEEEVYSNPKKAMAVAKKRGLDNVVVKDIHPGSVAEINALVEKEKPDVILVDQLRNLKSRADSRVNQLDEVARELRDVGKAHNIVVVDVTQAGESAEGKAILDMTDIDSSKTGVPGAADVLIGIGATKEMLATGTRALTLCKNKRNGNHTTVTVRVNPLISRYSDV